MKMYSGARTIDGIQVTVDGHPLDERVDIHQFTDGGFEWSYEGDAPQQLALALLADHLDDNKQALALCSRFTRQVIANLDNEWTLSSADIDTALNNDD